MPEGRSVSQVTLKTVFTVCFGALAVVALVYFLVKTQFSVILALGAALTAVVTLTLLAIFMLLFGGELIDSVLAEASPTNRDRYERVARKVYGSAGGYVGGVMAICSINASLTTTFLAITGMPFFLPLGIVSGLSSSIPYAGPAASAVTITLL